MPSRSFPRPSVARRSLHHVGLALLASAALTAAPAHAAGIQLYVDKGSIGGKCSDTRTYQTVTASAPWCSLARAVAAAPSGATVSVRKGSYPQLVTSNSRARTSYVSFRRYGSDVVTIAGLKLTNSSYLAFEGFSMPATPEIGADSDHVKLTGNTITATVNVRAGAHDLTIEGNTVSSLTGNAINFSSTATMKEISNVVIRSNRITRAVADAMQLKHFRNVVVESNEISGVARVDPAQHSDVLQTVFGGVGLIFRNNHAHNNAAGILLKDGATSGVVIENNRLVDNSGDGAGYAIQVWESSAPRIVNNTVWNNAYGVTMRSGVSGAVVKNNILQSFSLLDGATAAMENYNLILTGRRTGAKDLAVAPKFVATGNYALAAGSPGVDAATSDDAPQLDRLGLGRVDDPSAPNMGGGPWTYHDMGADERR